MGRDYHYTYEYNYPVSNSEGLVGVILSVYLIILTLILAFVLVSYIFHSVGLYTIGKRMGKEYPWLAFIPYARDYFQGELAGPIKLKNKEIKNPGIWNLVIPIISSVLAGVFGVLIILVTGVGAAAQISGAGGAGIALLFVIMMYTLLIVAVIAVQAAQMALKVLINKQILERFTAGNMGLVHAVLMIVVPLYEALCFFVMRKRDFNPGMEPEITPPPAPLPPVIPGGPEGPERPGGSAAIPPAPPQGGPEKPVDVPVSLAGEEGAAPAAETAEAAGPEADRDEKTE